MMPMMRSEHAPTGVLFDELCWRDPLSGSVLRPIVSARTPAGVPICGALQIPETNYGYPIVDCVVRLTPELAHRYREWLAIIGLEPPTPSAETKSAFQHEGTVESFGFQWAWNSNMRNEADLRWRVADRFNVKPVDFASKLVLDAGAGAGDQSRYLIDNDAKVVSIDLSSAIDVVAAKLRMSPSWVGVQGDITHMPFADNQFDWVYCEGVIQHTQDSARTVEELCRVLQYGGTVLATHYSKPSRLFGRVKHAYMLGLRNRLCRWDRYRLLAFTGCLAALAYVPLLGRLVRMSGTAVYYDLMPDFRTTWTNTFDNHGSHRYQRYVTPAEFWSYFERTGNMEQLFENGTIVVARKVS